MMPRSQAILVSAFLLLSVAVHGEKVDRLYDPLTGFAKWESSQPLELGMALRIVDTATKVTIYEGLPHNLFEAKTFRSEAERADILWVRDVPFYKNPLKVSSDDLRLLTTEYKRLEAHQAFSGLKECGGFHPDYYAVWSNSADWVGVMICLGCAEWISLTRDGYRYEDISKMTHSKLDKILRKYVSQRPKYVPSLEKVSADIPPVSEAAK